MATIVNNDLVKGFRGRFGSDLVFRTMRGKTFASPPARRNTNTKQSEAQRNTRINFQQAAEWAQLTLLDPEKKAYYKQRAKALKLPNAYTAAITDYMRKAKVLQTQRRETITYSISKPGFTVRQVQALIDDTTGATSQKIVVRKKNDRWLVHYTPDAGTSSTLTLIITDNAWRESRLRVNRRE